MFVTTLDRILYRDKAYTVTKVNPKNLVITDDDGVRYNLRRTATFVVVGSATAEQAAAALPARTPADAFAGISPGVVVEVTDSSQLRGFKYPAGTKFVVLKHNRDLVNIVKLGGEAGGYWRVAPTSLKIVTMEN